MNTIVYFKYTIVFDEETRRIKMLKIENLYVTKKGFIETIKRKENFILKGISLTLEKGTIYGLLGHNGAGKTTLLETLYDLNEYTGKITIDGIKLNKVRNRIAYLSSSISGTFTSADANSKSLSALDNFDLEEYRRLVNKFLLNNNEVKPKSRGEKRLVMVASVLAFNRDIYLLDEPLTGLDYDSKILVLDEIRSKALGNKIIVVSSHELDDINTSIDSAIFIKKGELIKIASLDEIRENEGLDLKEAFIKEYGGEISDKSEKL